MNKPRRQPEGIPLPVLAEVSTLSSLRHCKARPQKQRRAVRLGFAELPLQAFDLAAQLGEAACDRNLINKKSRPNNHPRGEQKFKVFHDLTFPATDCESRLRDSTSWRSSSNS